MQKIIRLILGLIFAVTGFFGFFYLMFLNILFFYKYFPGFINLQESLGKGKGAALLCIVITCPLPVIACYWWYRLYSWINGKLKETPSCRK